MALELIDVVNKVELHGFKPVHALNADGYWQRVGWTEGKVIVHYTKGTGSAFKVRASRVNLLHLREWLMHVPRGKVLDKIEAAIERAEGSSQMRKNLDELSKAKHRRQIETDRWFK